MERKRDEALEIAVGTMGVLTASGVLTFGLFPLMLPMVVLLGLLALPLLPIAVAAALLAAVYLVLRSAVRLARRARPATRLSFVPGQHSDEDPFEGPICT